MDCVALHSSFRLKFCFSSEIQALLSSEKITLNHQATINFYLFLIKGMTLKKSMCSISLCLEVGKLILISVTPRTSCKKSPNQVFLVPAMFQSNFSELTKNKEISHSVETNAPINSTLLMTPIAAIVLKLLQAFY